VTPSLFNPDGHLSLYLHVTALITLKGDALTNSFKNLMDRHVYFIYPTLFQVVRPSRAILEAVRYYFQHILETLPFSSLFAPKMSKMLPFPFFFKVPKMTKGTI
jgi:hypothetical protein